MRTLKMFVQRWKASIRKPYIWAFVLLAVMISTLPAFSLRYQSATKLPIGLVNEDDKQLSYDLEAYMDRYDKLLVFKLDRETALRYLAMGRLEAVYMITKGFTERMSKGEYEGVITMYTAPASSSAVLLSETVINKTLLVWMVETALLKTQEFLASEGIPFTPETRRQMYLQFNDLLLNGSTITIREHIPEPARTSGKYEALLGATGWYAAFVALFVITGAGWVIEAKKRALGERLRAAGIHPVSALTGSSLAVIAIAMAGWVAAVIAASGIAGYPIGIGLRMFLPVLLYMTGIMGLTLTVSAFLQGTVQLMLIAPVFTVTQGILCGMLVELPDWAGLLYYVSYIFPGRWLMLGADAALNGGNLVFVAGLAVCAAVWLFIGLLAVLAGSRKRATVRV
jgi:ABC-2 type transport system permease protein